MTRSLEVAANLLNAGSILLAGRNSLHTWWTGIAGCLAFGVVFWQARLYADVTLQLFFIITSGIGWWRWQSGADGESLPVRRTRGSAVVLLSSVGVAVALGYGALLHRFTDAYAPFLDSVILAFSALGQLLLMNRRYESWWCWLLVDTIAVPLYLARGLTLTAVLYFGFWLNAVVSLRRWRRLAVAS